MYELWFENDNHIPNQKYAAQVKDTFINGGYYKVDLDKDNKKVSVLALNTL